MLKVSNKITRYLELAKRQAQQSPFRQLRHGAVLVKSGRIINAAYNTSDSSSLSRRFQGKRKYPTRHAEIRVALGLDKSLTDGSTIVVCRINRFGQFRNSKPCCMCLWISEFVGIRKIIYTVGNGTKIDEIRL